MKIQNTIVLQKPFFVSRLYLTGFLIIASFFFHAKNNEHAHHSKQKQAASLLINQPVEFTENKGQLLNDDLSLAKQVLVKAQAPGLDLYLTEKGLSYVFLNYENSEDRNLSESLTENKDEKIKIHYERVDMDLAGASIKRENMVLEEKSEAYSNYLVNPLSQSIYGVHKYRKVTVKNVYPGIDWVLYNSTSKGFKYDFIVHEGANYRQIELLYKTKKELNLSKTGNIQINTTLGHLAEKAPYTYLWPGKQPVTSSFNLLSKSKKNGMYESRLGFNLGNNYSVPVNHRLVIDPQLVWSTFFGGNGVDGSLNIDADNAGNIVILAYNSSGNFPLLSTGTYYSSFQTQCSILKFNNAGVLLWSTYFGYAGITASGLDVDNNNNIFITASAILGALPVLSNGTYYQPSCGGNQDAYVAKFDNSGNLVWCTYYGGSGNEQGLTVSADVNGNVYITGTTTSTNFPVQTTGTYFDGNYSGPTTSYVVKFNNAGNRLWATYLNGLSNALVNTDNSGNAYITGTCSGSITLFNPGGTAYYQVNNAGPTDAALLKFDNACNLVWGTCFGGNSAEVAFGVITDKKNNVFIMGTTSSTNLPVQNNGTYFQPTFVGQLDLYLAKFDSTGTYKWGTYFGGTRTESISNYDNMSIDSCNNLYIGCNTISRNPPLVAGCDGGYFDNSRDTSVSTNFNSVYFARFSNAGSLLWSSYLGGDGSNFRSNICSDKLGNTIFSGEWCNVTNSSSYPLANLSSGSYSATFSGGLDDIYISKLSFSVAPQSFSYSGAYCTNDTNHLPIKPPGFLSGGTFTAQTGLSLNPLTGQVIPATSLPGTYTVNYLMNPCFCPATNAAVGAATLAILGLPSLSVTGNKTICVNQRASYSVTSNSSYTWHTGSTAPTLSVMPTSTAPIVFTVNATGSNGCSNSVTYTVNVSTCTWVDSHDKDAELVRIYPNPNKGTFTVESRENCLLSLTTELGQEVRRVELNAKNNFKANLSNLPIGLYFLTSPGTYKQQSYKIVVTD